MRLLQVCFLVCLLGSVAAAQDPGITNVMIGGVAPVQQLTSAAAPITVPQTDSAVVTFLTGTASSKTGAIIEGCQQGDMQLFVPGTDSADGHQHSIQFSALMPGQKVCFILLAGDAAKVPYQVPPHAAPWPVFAFNTAAIDKTAAVAYRLDDQGPFVTFAGGSLHAVQFPVLLAGAPTAYLDQYLELEDSAITVSPANVGISAHWDCNKSAPQVDTTTHKRYCAYQFPPLSNAELAVLHISAAASVPPGQYTVTAPTSPRANGFPFTVNHTFTVLPAATAAPARKMPAALPPIPGVDVQMKLMAQSSASLCIAGQPMAFGYEGQVWYYDGGRLYLELADALKDPSKLLCAQNILDQWAANNYPNSAAGWRAYSQGLKMWSMRFHDAAMEQAVHDMEKYATFWGSAPFFYQRETALALTSMVASAQLGMPENPLLGEYAEFVMGHLEIAHRGGAFDQPFYDGLAMQALIVYYEYELHKNTPDYRVPIVIKRSMDWIWANAVVQTPGAGQMPYWIAYSSLTATMGFAYPNAIVSPAYAGLNNLIDPAWAWYWNLTGDPNVLAQGDLLFQHGFDQDLSGYYNGKQFSQNGPSFEYTNYRSSLLPTLSLTDPTRNQYDAATAATLDTGRPDITAVAVVPSATGAVITWTTSRVASSLVRYGTTVAYSGCQPSCASVPADEEAAMVSSHTSTVTGLLPGTLYHFSVRSMSANGNSSASADQSFTTLAQ